METIKIKVEDVRTGDEFHAEGRHWWTAVENAAEAAGSKNIRLNIRHHPDQGRDQRYYEPGTEILVRRPPAVTAVDLAQLVAALLAGKMDRVAFDGMNQVEVNVRNQTFTISVRAGG